jgi:hypothetical protein
MEYVMCKILLLDIIDLLKSTYCLIKESLYLNDDLFPVTVELCEL